MKKKTFCESRGSPQAPGNGRYPENIKYISYRVFLLLFAVSPGEKKQFLFTFFMSLPLFPFAFFPLFTGFFAKGRKLSGARK